MPNTSKKYFGKAALVLPFFVGYRNDLMELLLAKKVGDLSSPTFLI